MYGVTNNEDQNHSQTKSFSDQEDRARSVKDT